MSNFTLYQTLFNELVKFDFCSISNELMKILNNPFVICDSDYRVIIQCPDNELDDMLWDSMYINKIVAPDMLYYIQKDGYQKDLDLNNNIIYIDYGVGSEIPRIVATIRFKNSIVGYICVLCLNNIPCKHTYRDIEIICQALGIILTHPTQVQASTVNIQQVFINYLFQQDYIQPSIIKKWLANKGITIKGTYRICISKVDLSSNEVVYLNQLRKNISTSANVFASVFANTIYILFSNLTTFINDEMFCEQYLKPLLDECNIYTLDFGISNSFDSLLDISLFKKQALNAYDLKSQNEVYGFYQKYVIEDMFHNINMQNLEERMFLHPSIQLLDNYDRLNHTEYSITLKTYIKSMCNNNKTIISLNIHRNTLLYRLRKIEEITHIDCKDERTCAQLLCNYYFLDRDEL